MSTKTDPFRPTDDQARILARELIDSADYGALGVLDPETRAPSVTRIAVATGPEGHPLTLISGLSSHTRALRKDPACSLLLGEPGDKGDPLSYPRITLTCRTDFIERDTEDYGRLLDLWLKVHPKAKLYAGFQDFVFATLRVGSGALNGGFGKAYLLAAADLAL